MEVVSSYMELRLVTPLKTPKSHLNVCHIYLTNCHL